MNTFSEHNSTYHEGHTNFSEIPLNEISVDFNNLALANI